MRQKKDRHITVALASKTYIRLAALAVEDKRGVSSLVRHIIKEYIQGVGDGSITLSTYSMFHEQL